MQNLDDIMREAVNNVKTKKYNLLGVDGDKYNCQDFVTDVRKEYKKIIKERSSKSCLSGL